MIMISRLALLAGSEVELLDVVLLDLPQPIQAVLVPSDLPFVLLDLLQPIHIYSRVGRKWKNLSDFLCHGDVNIGYRIIPTSEIASSLRCAL